MTPPLKPFLCAIRDDGEDLRFNSFVWAETAAAAAQVLVDALVDRGNLHDDGDWFDLDLCEVSVTPGLADIVDEYRFRLTNRAGRGEVANREGGPRVGLKHWRHVFCQEYERRTGITPDEGGVDDDETAEYWESGKEPGEAVDREVDKYGLDDRDRHPWLKGGD